MRLLPVRPTSAGWPSAVGYKIPTRTPIQFSPIQRRGWLRVWNGIPERALP